MLLNLTTAFVFTIGQLMQHMSNPHSRSVVKCPVQSQIRWVQTCGQMCFNVPPWSLFTGFHLTGSDPSLQNHHAAQPLKAHNFTRLCMLIWLFIKQAIICPLNLQVQKPGSTSVTWISFITENIQLWKKRISKITVGRNQLKPLEILTPEDNMVTTNMSIFKVPQRPHCWLNLSTFATYLTTVSKWMQVTRPRDNPLMKFTRL